jgi:hypothetical protein
MTWQSALRASNTRVYICATGAGAGIQEALWNIPGISSVLVGAEFPYAAEATKRFLGYAPESFCSEATAVALAMESYYRAYTPGQQAVGFGLTASVATRKKHRGEHRCYVATFTAAACRVWSVVLPKGHGAKRRVADGRACNRLGLAALLDTVLGGKRAGKSEDGAQLAQRNLEARPYWNAQGERRWNPPEAAPDLVLYPGAFNPPHEAHFWIARNTNATFQVTTNPPHKAALTVAQVLERAKGLEGYARYFTMGDPLYLDKARSFPGCALVMGADAFQRMCDPKWGLEIEPMFDEFDRLGTRFLVANRQVDGRVLVAEDVVGAGTDVWTYPVEWTPVPVPERLLDLASSRVRAAAE